MVNDQEPASGDPMGLLNLAARWRSEQEWKTTVEDLEYEPVPSELNTINSSGLFHFVSNDKKTVEYVGIPQHGHDVGVVQANFPAPTRRMMYYFEMHVDNIGTKGQISIGFTTQQFKMRRQPGWEANSCGYHGDDGYLYRGQARGETFGQRFETTDTIGAGINYASLEFFFTRNGQIVGTPIPKEIKGPLYPTVAVHSQNEKVTVNFDGKPAFLFKIEDYIELENLKQQAIIEKLSLTPNVSHRIVRSYLLHYGYQDTLKAFEAVSESTCPPVNVAKEYDTNEERNLYALARRKILRQHIKDGEIELTFRKLEQWYPQLLQDDTSVICFLLHSQRFIEYIKIGLLPDAVSYARKELAKFFTVHPFTSLLEEIVALLAYENPLESSLGYLLGGSQREFVADAVNAVILSTNPKIKGSDDYTTSSLERLLRQLTACSLERRALNGDQGDAFYLHRELLRSGRNKSC